PLLRRPRRAADADILLGARHRLRARDRRSAQRDRGLYTGPGFLDHEAAGEVAGEPRRAHLGAPGAAPDRAVATAATNRPPRTARRAPLGCGARAAVRGPRQRLAAPATLGRRCVRR